MIGLIGSILSSVAVAVAILNIAWVSKFTSIKSMYGLFASIILFASGCHFLTVTPMHDGILGSAFVVMMSFMNMYYTKHLCTRFNLGVNRRKEQKDKYDSPVDRRVEQTEIIRK